MTDIFLKLEEQLREAKPFAVFCKPGSQAVTGIFQNDRAVHYFEDYTQKGFVIAPFSGEGRIYLPYDNSDIITVPVRISEAPLNNSTIAPPIDTVTKSNFENLVRTSVSAIKEGRFEKLVVSRSETVPCESSPAELYQKLVAAYPNAYRYCFYTPVAGLWMGATPEQLLKIENHTLHTVALAGTQVFDTDKTAEWQEKERQEQEFVTRYILEKLEGLTTRVDMKGPYTFRAGNLVHLKTDISAELKMATAVSAVLDRLHPTPAVCGIPEDAARDFLLENEGYDREYYSGFLGEININLETGQPATDLFVNLRCMKLSNNEAQLFIGCGITKDSDPEKEFLETVNKSMTMRRIM